MNIIVLIEMNMTRLRTESRLRSLKNVCDTSKYYLLVVYDNHELGAKE